MYIFNMCTLEEASRNFKNRLKVFHNFLFFFSKPINGSPIQKPRVYGLHLASSMRSAQKSCALLDMTSRRSKEPERQSPMCTAMEG